MLLKTEKYHFFGIPIITKLQNHLKIVFFDIKSIFLKNAKVNQEAF